MLQPPPAKYAGGGLTAQAIDHPLKEGKRAWKMGEPGIEDCRRGLRKYVRYGDSEDEAA